MAKDEAEGAPSLLQVIPGPPCTPGISFDALEAGTLVLEGAKVVLALQKFGYCGLAEPAAGTALGAALCRLREGLRGALSCGSSVSTLQNGRLARNLSRESCGSAVAAFFEDSDIGGALAKYVTALEVQGVQDIRITGPCLPQELHRDHHRGRGRAVVLAVSLEAGNTLGTEFLRGTHLARVNDDDDEEEDDDALRAAALCDYVARYRYSTKRTPKSEAMFAHFRATGQLQAVDASWMCYDPFTFHRGASKIRSQEGRVFIMLCGAHLPADVKKDIARSNGMKMPWRGLRVGPRTSGDLTHRKKRKLSSTSREEEETA